jgi:hypothetical protein
MKWNPKEMIIDISKIEQISAEHSRDLQALKKVLKWKDFEDRRMLETILNYTMANQSLSNELNKARKSIKDFLKKNKIKPDDLFSL